jgi:hypothetical protein
VSATIPDHYAALGVTPDSSSDAIAAAYRRLARVHHPDVSNVPGAADRMRAINAAYSVLADPQLRATYDSQLARAVQHTVPSVETATPVRPAVPRAVASTRRERTMPTRAEHATKLAGIAFLTLFLGFGVLTCVLSSRLPISTGADGMPIIPRATATALARQGLSSDTPAQVSTPVVGSDMPAPAARLAHPVLRAFDRTVLVPPAGLAPFDELIAVAPQVSGTVCTGEPGCAPRYDIRYGDWRVSGARLAGSVGRGSFDSAMPPEGVCASESGVCALSTGAGRTAATHVHNLHVREHHPAVVRIQPCCPGPFWLVAWHDGSTDTSYRMELWGAAVNRLPTTEPIEGGIAIAAVASALVPLR